MIKKLKYILVLICFVKQGTAQNWEAVPCFYAKRPPNYMLLDSVHHEINLMFNSASKLCTKSFNGIIAYNGSNFHNLDIGLQTHVGSFGSNMIANTCIPFNNKTLYGGQFNSVGSNSLFSQSIASWDGIKWDTLAIKPFPYNPNKNNPIITGFYKDKGKLYIAGAYDTIGGVPAKNLSTFDGNSYTAINLPTNVNAVVTRLLRYKDGIYMHGLFYDSPSLTNKKLIKYNDDNTWSSVGNGIQGNFGSVNELMVYKDTLYIAGAYSKLDGNIGNHIMKWDGNQLYDAGFGSFYDWGGIDQLLIYKDRLYAFGNFSYAANEKAFGVAYYEKGKWFVPKDSIDNGIAAAVVYNDAIYIAGGFTSINADTTLKYFVKLRCPDFTGCYTNAPTQTNINIFPNPANSEINISVTGDFKYNSTISVYNDLGQLIFKDLVNDYNFKINCERWPKGIYLIHFQNTTKRKTYKLIKE